MSRKRRIHTRRATFSITLRTASAEVNSTRAALNRATMKNSILASAAHGKTRMARIKQEVKTTSQTMMQQRLRLSLQACQRTTTVPSQTNSSRQSTNSSSCCTRRTLNCAKPLRSLTWRPSPLRRSTRSSRHTCKMVLPDFRLNWKMTTRMMRKS